MKKFACLFICALALVAFSACNGSLHDFEAPAWATMDGYWFYYEIDTSAAADGDVNLIFMTSSWQTSDITGVASSGTVAYVVDTTVTSGTSDCWTTYYDSGRSDCPDKSIGGDSSSGVYVFVNTKELYIHCWDSANDNLTGTWMSTQMTIDADITIEKVNLTFYVKAINVSEGEMFWLGGNDLDWDAPSSGWGKDQITINAALEQTDRIATADDTGVASFGAFTIEVTADDTYTPGLAVCQMTDVSGTNTDDDGNYYSPDYAMNTSYSQIEPGVAVPATSEAAYTIYVDMSGDGNHYYEGI